MSTLLCMYGSQALLAVSKDILIEYNIAGKFKVIQFGFMSLSIPSAIIGLIGINGENNVYTSEIMTAAYVSVVSCVLFMILSFGYKYYFNQQTANEAFRNMTNQSFIVPKDENINDNIELMEDDSDAVKNDEEMEKQGILRHNNDEKLMDKDRTENLMELRTKS